MGFVGGPHKSKISAIKDFMLKYKWYVLGGGVLLVALVLWRTGVIRKISTRSAKYN